MRALYGCMRALAFSVNSARLSRSTTTEGRTSSHLSMGPAQPRDAMSEFIALCYVLAPGSTRSACCRDARAPGPDYARADAGEHVALPNEQKARPSRAVPRLSASRPPGRGVTVRAQSPVKTRARSSLKITCTTQHSTTRSNARCSCGVAVTGVANDAAVQMTVSTGADKCFSLRACIAPSRKPTVRDPEVCRVRVHHRSRMSRGCRIRPVGQM